MASPVPAKSQPLHNFSLPQLKWKKNHSNNLHRGRRNTESPPPHQSTPPRHHSPSLYASHTPSPLRESASESESGFASDHPKLSGIKISGSVHDSDRVIEKSEKDRNSKIYIRLRKSKSAAELVLKVSDENSKERLPEKDENIYVDKQDAVQNHEIEELVEPKTWNLRPRKPLHKLNNANNREMLPENKPQIGLQLNANTHTQEKEKKQKFSISLTREEIEYDISIFTGSRPSRKPKKRARVVQKHLDNAFPGMWLSSVTPDSYKVPDAPVKR